jgi:hypothetical protein
MKGREFVEKIAKANLYFNNPHEVKDKTPRILYQYTSDPVYEFMNNNGVKRLTYVITVDVCWPNVVDKDHLSDDALIQSIQESLMTLCHDHEYRYIECNGGKCRFNFIHDGGDTWCYSCNGYLEAHWIPSVLHNRIHFSTIDPNSIVSVEISEQLLLDWSKRDHLVMIQEFANSKLLGIKSMNDEIFSLDDQIKQAIKANEMTQRDENILNAFIRNNSSKHHSLVDLLQRKFNMDNGKFSLDPSAKQRLANLRKVYQTEVNKLQTYIDNNYPKETYERFRDLVQTKIDTIDKEIKDTRAKEKNDDIERQKKQIDDQINQLQNQRKRLN